MTHKVSVTYHAPPGDSKVVEAHGHTFFDGKAEEIEVDDDTLARLQGHRMFECGKPTEVKKDEPKKMTDAERKAADAKTLAEENEKRAAQGQPPLEDPSHPKSGGENHAKSGETGHAKEADTHETHHGKTKT
jgi:hypothetical protein